MAHQHKKEYSFVKKVWIVGLILSLITVILLIFKATFNILILILAGALIACFFRGLGNFVQRKTNWKSSISLLISVVGFTLIMGGVFYLVGATVTADSADLKESFPEMISEVETQLEKSDLGKEIIVQAKNIKSSDEFKSFLKKFFKTTYSGIADIYILSLLGIFFTISPKSYLMGVTQMVPPRGRKKTKAILNHLGSSLTKWLLGKFTAMVAVFLMTAIALFSLDIPMWLTLSILAGLLNFIPNFGPLVSAIPAILVAFSESPQMALIVAALYLTVQIIESSIVTPEAQKRLVSMPPALIILAQIFVGSLTGIWGVIFATPLVLIVIIIVQELYTKPLNKRAQKIEMRSDSQRNKS